MRITPFLQSAALVTALLATSANVNSAWAQKAAVLSPLTQWAITKVDGKQGVGGYCAMARRFKQNSILTFARNDSNEASIALDFQTPKLSTGQNIKIVLDPGAGEQRSYYISPISEQAFVVRMGKDEKFFSALQTTGLLRVEAGGESYNFNLADIDTGQTKLASCLENVNDSPMDSDGGEQASADDGSDGGGAFNRGNGNFHAELESLRKDVQGLKKENQRLAGLVTKAEPGQAAGVDDVVAEDLTNQANSLESENTALRAGKDSSGMSTGQAGSDEVAYNHLMHENQKLQKQMASLVLGQDDEPNGSPEQKIAMLERQNIALKTDLKKGPDMDEWRHSQAQLYTLKEENRRLQDLLEEKTAVKLAQAEPAAGDPTAAPTASDAPPVLAQMSDPPGTPAVPAATPDHPPSIDELMAQIRDKDAKLVEMSNLTMEVDSLRTKNKDLEQQLLDSVKDKDTISALNEKIQALTAENTQLKSVPGNEQIAALSKENADLKAQIESMKSQTPPAAADTAALNAQIATLTQQNADLKSQLDTLTTQNQSLQTDLKTAQDKTDATVKAEVKKAERKADKEKQHAMEGLAKENMALKKKLAEMSPPPAAEAPPAAEVAPAPMPQQHSDAAPMDEPSQPDIQVVDVSSPPDESLAHAGATEAQKQEAEMMSSMQGAPAEKGITPLLPADAPPAKAADEDIHWNGQPMAAPPSANGAPSPVQPVQAQAMPQVMPPSGGFSIQDVLVSAQIAQPADIHKVEKASVNGRVAYQWKSGPVFGSAEQKPMRDASQFESELNQYLQKTKSRCTGDFAASPDNSFNNGPVRIESYEIACVGHNINSSASLLFIDKAGTFTVVAHEAAADKMDQAMNMSDRVLKTIGGS